jgi:hypothetical protein
MTATNSLEDAKTALWEARAEIERLTANCKGWYYQNVNLIEQRDKVWEENKSLRSNNARLQELVRDALDDEVARRLMPKWCEDARRALEPTSILTPY